MILLQFLLTSNKISRHVYENREKVCYILSLLKESQLKTTNNAISNKLLKG